MHNRKNLFKILALLAVFSMLLTACVATPPPAAAPPQRKVMLLLRPAPASGDDAAAARGVRREDPTALGEHFQLLKVPSSGSRSSTHSRLSSRTSKSISESTAGSGAAVYPDVLKTSMASGNPPDLFFMWGGSIAEPFVDAGQVMDLAPYYEKYNWNGKYAPWVVDRITLDGKLYGVPYHALGMGFWYRKDIFEQNGWTAPTTFAEQEALCAAMKEKDMYCVSLGGKFGWHTMRVLDYFLEHHCGPAVHDQLNSLEASWDQQCVVDSYNDLPKVDRQRLGRTGLLDRSARRLTLPVLCRRCRPGAGRRVVRRRAQDQRAGRRQLRLLPAAH